MVSEFTAHDLKLQFAGLNHDPVTGLNFACAANGNGFSVAFRPIADSLCSH